MNPPGLPAEPVRIRFNYVPRPWQKTAHEHARRFNVLVLARRSGKTHWALMELLTAAVKCQLPLGLFAYLAPELKQAKAVAWAILKYLVRDLVAAGAVEIAESEVSLRFKHNGAVLRLFGANNPDALRGLRLDGVVMDEVAQMPPEVWEEIIQYTIADRKGWVIFIGTVKGIDLFSEMYHRARKEVENGSQDWYVGLWDCYTAKALDEDEINRTKDTSSPAVFAREMLCDFNAQADDQLISLAEAVEASRRRVNPRDAVILSAPVILGVDPARFGSDRSVIIRRQGLIAFPPSVHRGVDNMTLAMHVANAIIEHKPAAVFIDSGGGAGVIDRLRQLSHEVVEVHFAGKALDTGFLNRRAEMWWTMREWVRSGGVIPDDQSLIRELATPTYWFNGRGQRVLESKDDIRARLRDSGSPDIADALALTFAAPVAARLNWMDDRLTPQRRRDYEPFGRKGAPRGHNPFKPH